MLMRSMLHRLIAIAGVALLASPLARPALAAPCTGTVVIGEGSSQIVTSVPNKSFQGVCFNNLIVDTAAEGADWANHGEFMSHVAKLVAAWRDSGMMSARQAGELTSAAARSHVGKTIDVRIIAFNDFHGTLLSPGTFGVQAGGPGTPIVNKASGGVDVMAAYVAA